VFLLPTTPIYIYHHHLFVPFIILDFSVPTILVRVDWLVLEL
jgi:hypothetical protein